MAEPRLGTYKIGIEETTFGWVSCPLGQLELPQGAVGMAEGIRFRWLNTSNMDMARYGGGRLVSIHQVKIA